MMKTVVEKMMGMGVMGIKDLGMLVTERIEMGIMEVMANLLIIV